MKISYLHKYLSGECNAKEKEAVKKWLNASKQNQEYFEALKLIWDVSPKKNITVDAEAAWESVRPQNLKKTKSIKNPVLPSAGQQKNNYSGSFIRQHAHAFAYSFAAAAVILIAVMFTQFVPENKVPTQPTQEMQEVITERGQRTTLRLIDGTRIQLNVESQLEIPADFNSTDRQVYLEGEAYFEVVSNPAKPFIVHTPEGVTKVLGTKFAVRTYPCDSQVQVVVVEGKVSLGPNEDGTAQAVHLTRNRRGIYTKNGNLEVTEIENLDEHIGWKAGKLTFRNAPLTEVRQRLERWYDIEITFKNEFSSLSRRLTASFKNEPLTEVLKVTALALDVKYEREGQEVIIFQDK